MLGYILACFKIHFISPTLIILFGTCHSVDVAERSLYCQDISLSAHLPLAVRKKDNSNYIHYTSSWSSIIFSIVHTKSMSCKVRKLHA